MDEEEKKATNEKLKIFERFNRMYELKVTNMVNTPIIVYYKLGKYEKLLSSQLSRPLLKNRRSIIRGC